MEKGYRKDIDGLRAIAILLVFFYHLGAPFAKTGFVGVDIFFVISGFLITQHILQDLSAGKFSIRQFYTKRMRRILPALLTVVFCSTIAAFIILLPQDLCNYLKAALAALTSIANLYYWKFIFIGYFGTNAKLLPLLHTWSLGVEEQFYILWPLLLFLIFRLPKSVQILCALIALAISFSFYDVLRYHALFVYYSPITRGFELLLGALLAMGWPYLKKITLPKLMVHILSLVGLLLIIYGGCLTPITSYPGWIIWLPLLGSVMLIFCGAHHGIGNKIISLQPFPFIGLISYSLYLWHWPIIAYLHYLNVPITLVTSFLVFFAAVVLSVLSWRWVELPFRFQFKLGFFKSLLCYVIVPCALVVLLLFSLSRFPNMGLNRIDSKAYAIANDYYGPLAGHHCIDAGALTPASEAQCSIGDMALSKDTVLVVGDSHARAFAGMLSVWLSNAHLKGYIVTQSGSPFMLRDVKNWRHNQPMTRSHEIVKLIREHHYHYVVMGGYWNYYPDSAIGNLALSTDSYSILQEGLENAVNFVEKSGAIPVIFLDNPPLLDVSKYCGFTSMSRPKDRCYNNEARILKVQQKTRNLLFQLKRIHPNLRLIDLTKGICSHEKCWSTLDGIPLYFSDGNNSHLNYYGSTLVGRLYLKQYGNPFSG